MDHKLPRERQIKKLFRRIEESTASLISVSSSPPALCDFCQRLRFQPLREGQHYRHGKPDEVTIRAQSGCPLCTLIAENFDLGPSNIPIRLSGIRKKLSPQEKASLVEEGDIEALGVLNGYDRELENPFAHKLALYTNHDDIAAPFIKRRPPIQDFASESTYRLIKSWLDTCILHHPGCSNSSVISKLPTRVVDVGLPGTRQDPTLFTPPQGYKDSYIALSYCWGNAGSRFVLTKEMADLPRLRFPFDSLPRTLQDAVTITRKLGFRFLWIDALCIIQEGDQGADFLRESATMSAVYGNAALTIAAAGASNVNEGIFRKINTEPDRAAQIPYDLPDGNTGIAFVTFEPVDQGDSRINEPLNTRGWTFQERILSRRVVLFYKDQLSWDCTSTLINSNGPLNPHIRYNQDSPGRYSDYVVSRALTDNSEKTRLKEDSDYWRNLVEFYSRRQLTDTSDKLKAISGLAQLIKSETNDSYLAGLWLSDLRNQLFWHTRDPKEKRQEEYRAPTWSWASVDGQIRFWSQGSINYILGDGYNEPTAIVDYQPDTDEFGIVLRGRLSFKGHLCPFNLELFEERQLTLYEFEKSPSFYGLFFDTSSDKEEFFLKKAKHAHFFFHPEQQAVRRTSELYEVTLAMVLKKVDGTYRRVGIYMKRDGGTLFAPRWAKWLDEWVDVSPETITIE